ncbi:HNH endonuclease [Ruegeria sp. HKCCSP351]|uniref:HNH endonuclease n=1 Tax=Ruegeria sp. HKCCSP351 TaxID=2794832 RepID=UPI001AE81C4C|nr:HNH endonuclease [Ruegeria sp. HKCCSP351]
MAGVTVEYLRGAVRYDPETGLFYWLWRPDQTDNRNRKYAGKRAFTTLSVRGEYVCRIDGRLVGANRAAIALIKGRWPENDVEHINGVKTDNRYVNLRECTQAENRRNYPRQSNNTSGTTGVVWDKRKERWIARIKVDGRMIWLGRHLDKDDAIAARKAAEAKYGFDPMHGRSAAARAERKLS